MLTLIKIGQLPKKKLAIMKRPIADFTKFIEIDPNNAEAYNNRGIAKRNINDYEGALLDYNKAIEINP